MANSSRQYVLKFALPDSKKTVVLDCGNRVHLSDFERPTAPAPSHFVSKLRKHLKSRRLSQLRQLGNDRVLVFQFSDGLYYLVLEFFSAGNVLLLDQDRKILSLQRLVNDLGTGVDRHAINETYNMFDESLFADNFTYTRKLFDPQTVKLWVETHREKLKNDTSEKKKKVFSIHKLAFVNASHLSSDLILRGLAEAGVTPGQSCLEIADLEELLEKVCGALHATEDRYIQLLESISHDKVRGVIVEKKNPMHDPLDKDSLDYVYDEFHPFEPLKTAKDQFRFKEITGYNKTLDHFFTTLESTKYALRIEHQKQHAQKRLDTARNERDKQIQLLQLQQESNEKKGNSIIYHADLIEQCKTTIQEMINRSMDWTNIESVVKMQQSRGDALANHIKLPLKLKENKIMLRLPDPDVLQEKEEERRAKEARDTLDESDSELDSDSDSDTESQSESDSDADSDSDSDANSEFEESRPARRQKTKKSKPEIPDISVEIDLSLTAYANASLYFDSKKTAVSKQSKVEQNTELALKSAQRKIELDLAKNLKKEVDDIKAIRPRFWFEKFFWFVTSDGYLCLAGRDDLQTDMIYYRHFSDNDYLVSADIEGSLKVFIKNPFKAKPLSPSTLFQAGIFALSASQAWNGKASSSAWFLAGNEVSKKDFDDTLLAPGLLNYKGKKNYMPPAQLVMGFGLYWLAHEETAKKYTAAREEKQQEHGLEVDITNKKRDLENVTFKSEPQEKEQQTAPTEEMKKDEETTDNGHEQEEEETAGEEDVAEKLDAVTLDNKPKSAVRGKKGKLKKISAKYADQDEEEKRQRMEVLGTLKQVKEEQKRRQEEAERKAKAEKEKYADKKADKTKKAEEKQLQKYLEEDEGAMDVNYLEILDSLLPKQSKSDEIGAVVPVFAPWSALNKFKYKAKVQPGLGKKGKALSDALAYFSNRKVDESREDDEEDWPEEHNMVKDIKSNDVMAIMTVNKLKLVLPGGASNDKGKDKAKGSGGGKGGSGKGSAKKGKKK